MIREITPTEVAALQESPQTTWQLIDVREDFEVALGKIAGAAHLSLHRLQEGIKAIAPDLKQLLILYCAAGRRSMIAAKELAKLGYSNLASMQGGIGRWQTESRALQIPDACQTTTAHRYQRQLLLPEIGSKGQVKLASAKVLIIGAGGLGSPAALYLTAAGVGQLGLVDHDRVELSNLHRQILHSSETIGTAKVVSAHHRLQALNPTVRVETFETKLSTDNAATIFANYDLIIDGCDNFPTRQTIAKTSQALSKPLVYGAVQGFKGQVSIFYPPLGPCYECLFKELPPPGVAPSCAEAGVLGVVPGVVGMLQATEALKWILGIGKPLIGRLLLYDALSATFSEHQLRRDPDCRCATMADNQIAQ